ncbi:MAG: hypothetical protein PUD53_01805 [Oscillospiraceae bacterium]|nr:hypothetical protein [Oscillospiraceae bacterium]
MDMNEEDGGVVQSVNTNAPKTIKSKQIIIFECKFSTLAFLDLDEEIGNRVYILEARLENEFVNGRYRHRSRFENNVDVKFKAEPSFMECLQRIIEEHNLAKNNGVCYKVKGLPDMYGAKLMVDYASGERIYTSNNQDNFLSVSAIKEMLRLFRKQLS